MHTVPRGYLRAFADASIPGNEPHGWRVEREHDDPKPLAISNISVSTDIYTLWPDPGVSDTFIETELFQNVWRTIFRSWCPCWSRKQPSYWGWRALSLYRCESDADIKKPSTPPPSLLPHRSRLRSQLFWFSVELYSKCSAFHTGSCGRLVVHTVSSSATPDALG